MTADILAFVKACLADDERLAWEWAEAEIKDPNQKGPRQPGDPIRFNPGNILNDVGSKRLTIALYEETVETAAAFRAQGLAASAYDVAAESYLNVIRLIAYAYRNRDGYRAMPEWMPGWIAELSH